jgi:hypothetical protein
MPLTALVYLYLTEQDILDRLSVEGEQLSINDTGTGSGDTVTVTADAAAAAVSLTVIALTSALPKGRVLQFSGGSMTTFVLAQLTADASIGAVALSVLALTGAISAPAVAIDLGVTAAEQQRIATARYFATTKVNQYCLARYDDSEMVNSWIVNQWAVPLGACWVRRRRGNDVPKSLADDCIAALEDLQAVQAGTMLIADIPLRAAGWPAWSNVTVDTRYRIKKVRVQRPISEKTPTQYSQIIDWNAEFAFEEY